MKLRCARISLLLLLLMLVACGQQNNATPVPVNLDMSARVEPEPPAVGEATLIVTLKDAAGSPVDNAALKIHGDMDHEGMASVDHEVSQSANGEYRVPFEWTMGGGWIITVTAHLPDGGEVIKIFDFFVDAVSSESIINRSSSKNDAEVNITYQPAKEPVILGSGPATITLTTEDGTPVTNARIEVTNAMQHDDMLPMSAEGEHSGNGQYDVPLIWTMAGEWQVTVKVTLADGRQLEQTFDQEVSMPG